MRTGPANLCTLISHACLEITCLVNWFAQLSINNRCSLLANTVGFLEPSTRSRGKGSLPLRQGNFLRLWPQKPVHGRSWNLLAGERSRKLWI